MMHSLQDILGQDRAVSLLRHLIRTGRLPHGMIFAGPAGVGKRTAAEALAAQFLCHSPLAENPCGRCESCRLLVAGTHPDYQLIYRQLIRLEKEQAKAKELSIDLVREYLIRPAGLKPNCGRGRVFVVEEAELMSVAAQNALLRTLEEPGGRSLIVLLTDQPERLLPTVRSRCQMLRFLPLDESLIRQELQRRGLEPSLAANAARFAEGSLGLALRWAEDGVVQRAGQLSDCLQRLLAGNAPEDLADWMRLSCEEYAQKQLERDRQASRDQAIREGAQLYLDLAGQFLRRQLPLLQGRELARLCAVIEQLSRQQQYLEANVNVALISEHLAVTLNALCGTRAGAPPAMS